MAFIVVVRHGQTDFNIAGRVQGMSDIALNAVGLEQAASMAPHIARLNPDLIVSSPLLRATQTAQAIQAACLQAGRDLPIQTDADLVERSFGPLEGMTNAEMEATQFETWQAWRHSGEAPGIEPQAEVAARAGGACQRASDALAADGVAVIVSHGGAIGCAIGHLLGQDAATWRGIGHVNNCHWSVLGPGSRPPYWRLLAHNIGIDPAGVGAAIAAAKVWEPATTAKSGPAARA